MGCTSKKFLTIQIILFSGCWQIAASRDWASTPLQRGSSLPNEMFVVWLYEVTEHANFARTFFYSTGSDYKVAYDQICSTIGLRVKIPNCKFSCTESIKTHVWIPSKITTFSHNKLDFVQFMNTVDVVFWYACDCENAAILNITRQSVRWIQICCNTWPVMDI